MGYSRSSTSNLKMNEHSGRVSESALQRISRISATYGTQQTSSPKVGATTSHEGRKWRRFGADGDEETNTLQCQLIEVLEKNGKILCAQLKAQNTNFQLDREQRKDHTGSLVTVLNKLADALGRIVDKL
ncbi:trihelix transcription factor ASR3-like [Camellia sinensis]|uniref:trihelix transcription factor ASR3-like n=1 Tax=Camellia sinensis TaxID=4442 RepID=UPI0010364A9D|nr:trihelix transcription factor ASR3-like [Camellia sinensis]